MDAHAVVAGRLNYRSGRAAFLNGGEFGGWLIPVRTRCPQRQRGRRVGITGGFLGSLFVRFWLPITGYGEFFRFAHGGTAQGLDLGGFVASRILRTVLPGTPTPKPCGVAYKQSLARRNADANEMACGIRVVAAVLDAIDKNGPALLPNHWNSHRCVREDGRAFFLNGRTGMIRLCCKDKLRCPCRQTALVW